MQACVRPDLLLILRRYCRIGESRVHETVCERLTLVHNSLLVSGHNVLGQAFKVRWHFNPLLLLWGHHHCEIVLAVLLDDLVDGGLGLNEGINIVVLQTP